MARCSPLPAQSANKAEDPHVGKGAPCARVTSRDEAHVEFAGVRMAFGQRVVFRDLSCRFPRGRLSVILGGSGSGKSTLLRLIGGLVRPQAGRIVVDGDEITTRTERQMYAGRKKLRMMVPDGALLDSLTLFENLAFPLREPTAMREPEIAAAVPESPA